MLLSAPRVCSEPGGQKPILSLSLDRIGFRQGLVVGLACCAQLSLLFWFWPLLCTAWPTGIVTHWGPRQDGRHFPDNIFKCIFLNETAWILIKISLMFVPKNSIDNIPTLVQIMAWRRPGDKPLSEPMLVSLLTHICVTRPQWVNASFPETCGCDFKRVNFKHILGIDMWVFEWTLPSDECHRTLFMVGQHWFR